MKAKQFTVVKLVFCLLTASLFALLADVASAAGQGLTVADSRPGRAAEARGSRPEETDSSVAAAPRVAKGPVTTPVVGDLFKEEKKRPSGDSANTSDTDMPDRVRALEKALQTQNEKLEQMQRVIAEQQQTIQLLSGKQATLEAVTADAAASPASGTATASGTAGQSQGASLEDRVKKVEDRLLKVGPFRLSGDFRLRLDAILRSADTAPPPGFAPLTHQQNVRARYRLRLNFDTDIEPTLSFHGQLTTGPINNPLTNDQDFTSTVARAPFFINEAWIDYHPNKNIQLQGGRLQEAFADNSRFLFDDDVRFNGFNEKYIIGLKNPFAYITNVELRAGQYIFTNPNLAIVTKGSPLANAGAIVGSTGRSSNLFHQGVLFNQKYNERWGGQFGGDIQFYRNPNQIQLSSTTDGLTLLVQPGLGLALSGPLSGTGNATTTPGGVIYTARNFQIVRLTYRLNWAGFKEGDRLFPVTFNAQASRNVGVGIHERDAMLAALQVGKVTRRGDTSYLYIFTIKGANSLISQLTDDDLGTNSGVNIRTHAFRFEIGLSKKVTFQSLAFIQRQLRNSGQFPNFFVPLNAFTPRQFRLQEQIVFTF